MQEKKEFKSLEKTAVAVAYEPGESAPKILATGKGEVAERIIEKAKENDVPLYKDNKYFLCSSVPKIFRKSVSLCSLFPPIPISVVLIYSVPFFFLL